MTSAQVTNSTADRVDVTVRRELRAPSGTKRAVHELTLTVLRGGTLHLANTAAVSTVHSESLARVGLGFTLPCKVRGPSMAFRGLSRPSTDLHGLPWPPLTFHGLPWPPVASRGFPPTAMHALLHATLQGRRRPRPRVDGALVWPWAA